MEVDRGNVHSESEYMTLACQLASSADKIETLHLKVNFHDGEVSGDRDTPVMQACAVIVGEVETNTRGVYEGIVSINEAAIASRYSGACEPLEATAEYKAVRVWLQDARAALTEKCVKTDVVDDLGKHDTEYVYCLQVENNDYPETVTLSWKLKHKFCMVSLGSICLSKVTESSELIRQMSVKFIKPLICSFLTEKRRHHQVIGTSFKTKNQLLEDNQRLIDQLKLMTESRRHDDERMMARFLEILNTKKLRIAEIQHELSQLKKQQVCENPVQTLRADEEKLLTVNNGRRRRGTGRCYDGYKKTNLKAKVKDNHLENNGVALKKQKTENMNVHQNFVSEPMVMDVNAGAIATVNEEKVKVFPVVDNLTLDPFEANTQIDPDSDNSSVDLSPESPSWLQPSSPIQALEQQPMQSSPTQVLEHPPLESLPVQLIEQPPMQSSPIQLLEQRPMQSLPVQKPPEQKSVLDTLWGGIL